MTLTERVGLKCNDLCESVAMLGAELYLGGDYSLDLAAGRSGKATVASGMLRWSF